MFKVRDRVRITAEYVAGDKEKIVGRIGTVVSTNGTIWPYRVLLDGEDEDYPFSGHELEKV